MRNAPPGAHAIYCRLLINDGSSYTRLASTTYFVAKPAQDIIESSHEEGLRVNLMAPYDGQIEVDTRVGGFQLRAV
jgi:hypothetical protein